MTLTCKGSFNKLDWKTARTLLIQFNPVLTKIIDKINPSDKYWLAKVNYPYGSLVMKKSLLQLPNAAGDIVPLTDPSIAPDLQEGLGYNLCSNPVSVVLKNTFEIFLPLEDRTIPLSGLIKPGTAFGAWRMLNPDKTQQPAFIWDMTAGARSVFMLPKITEAKKHKQLMRKYDLTVDIPKSLMGHWDIFREVANSPHFQTPWSAEILYFPIQWFQHLEDSDWKEFYQFFREAGWGNSEFWRNQPIWNLIFSLILKDYEARPSAYIMDTVKYLVHIGMGALPGLAPARNDLAGPFQSLQKIYLEDYKIKNHPPIIIQPDIFDMYDSNQYPIYYSLQFPNALEFKPNSRSRESIISDLHEIRSLLIRCEKELLSGKYNIHNTSLSDVLSHTQYDYFHNCDDLHIGMRNSDKMPLEDSGLITTLDDNLYSSFPDRSAFVSGCIRLSRKIS